MSHTGLAFTTIHSLAFTTIHSCNFAINEQLKTPKNGMYSTDDRKHNTTLPVPQCFYDSTQPLLARSFRRQELDAFLKRRQRLGTRPDQL
jgi:hypothetical protein